MDCGFSCFMNNKTIFHWFSARPHTLLKGSHFTLSITLLNTKGPASCSFPGCNECWKSLLTGLNLADYYPCDLFGYLLVKSFRGSERGGRDAMQMFSRWGQRLAFPLRSKKQGDSKTWENRPLSEQLLHPQTRREWGGGGWLPLAGKWPAVECIFKGWCKRN